jgi:hypothetical protein
VFNNSSYYYLNTFRDKVSNNDIFPILLLLGIAYVPYFIVYKYSALSEYSNIWRYAQAALGFDDDDPIPQMVCTF